MKNHLIELIPADPSLAEALCAYYTRNREFLRPFEPAREESFFTAEHQCKILESEVSDIFYVFRDEDRFQLFTTFES